MSEPAPENIQAAIQAAWMVSPAFAAELAKRYGIYDRMCLRCANNPLAVVDPTKVLVEALGKLAFQLCLDCHYAASRDALLTHMLKKKSRR